MILRHYTLNTGNLFLAPRLQNAPSAIAFELLSEGDRDLPEPCGGYRLRSSLHGTAFMSTIWSPANRPLLTFGVATESRQGHDLWKQLVLLFEELREKKCAGDSNKPGRGPKVGSPPTETPWLASVVLFLSAAESRWAVGLQHDLAWSWIERTALEVN